MIKVVYDRNIVESVVTCIQYYDMFNAMAPRSVPEMDFLNDNKQTNSGKPAQVHEDLLSRI